MCVRVCGEREREREREKKVLFHPSHEQKCLRHFYNVYIRNKSTCVYVCVYARDATTTTTGLLKNERANTDDDVRNRLIKRARGRPGPALSRSTFPSESFKYYIHVADGTFVHTPRGHYTYTDTRGNGGSTGSSVNGTVKREKTRANCARTRRNVRTSYVLRRYARRTVYNNATERPFRRPRLMAEISFRKSGLVQFLAKRSKV